MKWSFESTKLWITWLFGRILKSHWRKFGVTLLRGACQNSGLRICDFIPNSMNYHESKTNGKISNIRSHSISNW